MSRRALSQCPVSLFTGLIILAAAALGPAGLSAKGISYNDAYSLEVNAYKAADSEGTNTAYISLYIYTTDPEYYPVPMTLKKVQLKIWDQDRHVLALENMKQVNILNNQVAFEVSYSQGPGAFTDADTLRAQVLIKGGLTDPRTVVLRAEAPVDIIIEPPPEEAPPEDPGGGGEEPGGEEESGLSKSIGGAAMELPAAVSLEGNYPNPFNPGTTLQFALPEGAPVSLVIYDLVGREVARLVDGFMEAGRHEVFWNGRTASGSAAPTGVYLARLVTPGYTRTLKMVMLK